MYSNNKVFITIIVFIMFSAYGFSKENKEDILSKFLTSHVDGESDCGKFDKNYELLKNKLFVISQNITVNEKGALLYAIASDNYRHTKRLLEEGANIDIPIYGTLLHVAATHGSPKLLSLLVHEGIGVNQKGMGKEDQNLDLDATPLVVAANYNRTENALWLIDIGADIHIAPNKFDTPLYYAVFCKNQKLTQKLISHGANISEKIKILADKNNINLAEYK